MLEDVGHSHVLLLKIRVRVLSGAGGHAAGKVGKVAVGDALLECQVFQRRDGRVVVVDEQLAFLERVLLVEPSSNHAVPSNM